MTGSNIIAWINEKIIHQNGIDIAYPRVEGLTDQKVQNKINRAVEDRVYSLIARQREWPDTTGLKIVEMKGTYKIGVNKNGILSISFENYMYPEMAAHGTTIADSITVDLETGQVYTLRDLFQPGTDYIMALNKIIREQFKEKDLPLINEFNGITVNQNFYLTKKALVIYFQAYEYTPGYVGIPEFAIPYRTITNYINKRGPVGRLV